tara:strand:- start:3577 stop:4767 length:1191 start_codon:yes stop_codon:yes gene_type:complete
MYFQTLDDKTECVGIYKDGKLHFSDIPADLKRTWRYGGDIGEDAEYAWLRCGGLSLEEVCPENILQQYKASVQKMRAFHKSFIIAKIDFNEHCIYDLIPHDALVEFCDIKNQITKHVFDAYEEPSNYEFLVEASKLLHSIRHRGLNVDISDCKSMFTSTINRNSLRKIMDGSRYIDYNLFGTVTGRLTTNPGSFPILTMKKELRRILKPHNDWFISLDYNAAEPRTILALLGHEQPDTDIHQWNVDHILGHIDPDLDREKAKVLFFGWLYNPESTIITSEYYDRETLLDKHYKVGYIETPFGRRIQVDQRKAFNYLIQSTTSDLVIDRALAIDEIIKDKKSFISHIIHDELVLDMPDDERYLIPEIKEVFKNNKLGKFEVNLQAGRNCFDLGELNL